MLRLIETQSAGDILMSVYLDHVYIKPTEEAYDNLFNIFKKVVGEDLLQHGEFDDGQQSWGGFYLYFDNGSFLEVLNPKFCQDSQSVGLCISCEKQYRGHFLNQIEDVLVGKEIEKKTFSEDGNDFSICRLSPERYITTWGAEYSDQWFKEWGSRSNKFGLLYPLESIRSLKFTYPTEQKVKVQDNLEWIDPRACSGEITLPLRDSGATSLAFEKGKSAQCELSFFFDSDEIEDFEISGEGYSVVASEGVISLVANLTM